MLLRAADLLEADFSRNRDSLALEVGAVRGWAEMNTAEAAATLREAAGLASSPLGSVLPSADPSGANLSLRTAAGVVLAIVPWNAPVVQSARSVAIALALGNTVILRPSELAPHAAGHLLADVLTRAGAPAGVVNVVTCSPSRSKELVASLVAEPAVRRVVFIGSTPVGRSIASVAGNALTPAVLELGGKNPTLVLSDADLDTAADRIVFAAFANSGQVCMSTDRVLVATSAFAELCERVAARAAALPVGDPRLDTTAVGPLITDAAAARFTSLAGDAVSRGARLLTGGSADGRYATPTVLTDVSPDSPLYSTEFFAPLVTRQPYADEPAMIAAANDTPYGLIASVLSSDPSRAWHLARSLRCGAVHVNGPSVGDEPHVPFGGLAASGYGRLGGIESVLTFTEQRTFYLHDTDVLPNP
ncbi:aldehyde dehydrogenase family protein [Amycolatopsis sp. FDAARGOS 1241]|uniref:aldehyde dehydrogenase family protein n=1 Tax=Amycolatopsis sp. FDAARGOS 1241 TaxID=2778070 RepID=UPI001EF1D8C0|nr:aldehyde dehydrogenase family protein [Amycolatopsis sp. FDAARGOS 1241]